MDGDVLDEFYELVVSICDNLYSNHHLITKKAVQKIAELHGSWTAEQLELLLPKFINEWRLHNLSNSSMPEQDQITLLEAQVCKYKADLQQAHQTINKLKFQLSNESTKIKLQRDAIIAELRALLEK